MIDENNEYEIANEKETPSGELPLEIMKRFEKHSERTGDDIEEVLTPEISEVLFPFITAACIVSRPTKYTKDDKYPILVDIPKWSVSSLVEIISYGRTLPALSLSTKFPSVSVPALICEESISSFSDGQ